MFCASTVCAAAYCARCPSLSKGLDANGKRHAQGSIHSGYSTGATYMFKYCTHAEKKQYAGVTSCLSIAG